MTAITVTQKGDSDFNPLTKGDPDRLLLITNPAYPDYSSGANSLSGARSQFSRAHLSMHLLSPAKGGSLQDFIPALRIARVNDLLSTLST